MTELLNVIRMVLQWYYNGITIVLLYMLVNNEGWKSEFWQNSTYENLVFGTTRRMVWVQKEKKYKFFCIFSCIIQKKVLTLQSETK